MVRNRARRKKKSSPGGIFIPAGVLIGMGIGFLVDSLTAWLFIGLGLGFLLFGLYEIFKKK
ncbi:hypothetical protein ACFLZJ_01065 [Nanoarchaeota archaeon]